MKLPASRLGGHAGPEHEPAGGQNHPARGNARVRQRNESWMRPDAMLPNAVRKRDRRRRYPELGDDRDVDERQQRRLGMVDSMSETESSHSVRFGRMPGASVGCISEAIRAMSASVTLGAAYPAALNSAEMDQITTSASAGRSSWVQAAALALPPAARSRARLPHHRRAPRPARHDRRRAAGARGYRRDRRAGGVPQRQRRRRWEAPRRVVAATQLFAERRAEGKDPFVASCCIPSPSARPSPT